MRTLQNICEGIFDQNDLDQKMDFVESLKKFTDKFDEHCIVAGCPCAYASTNISFTKYLKWMSKWKIKSTSKYQMEVLDNPDLCLVIIGIDEKKDVVSCVFAPNKTGYGIKVDFGSYDNPTQLYAWPAYNAYEQRRKYYNKMPIKTYYYGIPMYVYEMIKNELGMEKFEV